MMLTFNVKLDEIKNGTKTTTIRIFTETRFKHYHRWKRGLKNDENFHIWWLNPRNQHPHCHKIGTSPIKDIRTKLGKDLDNQDAINDGFTGIKALREILMDINKIPTDREFDNASVFIYEWNHSDLLGGRG